MRLVDIKGVQKLISIMGFKAFFQLLIQYMQEDLKNWPQFAKKPRVAFYLKEGIIELMPIAGSHFFANKFVCTHPNNHLKSQYGVMAMGLWVDTQSGEPLMLSEMTFLTALRTAAVSVMVSLSMAPLHAKKFSIVGCGAQSHFQVLAHHLFFDFEEYHCFDVNQGAMARLIHEMAPFGITIQACHSAELAVFQADIITTATNALRIHPILDSSILHPQLHINAIGGDAPGYSELCPSILQQVDKIVVEYLPQTQHEGEIQQLPFHLIQEKIIEVHELVNQPNQYRRRQDEITLFDSVGFALFDYSTLRMVDDLSKQYDFYQEIAMVPPFDRQKSLFQQLVDADD